jgi:oxalate decarboxylase/phosphoglucose isomerase-like protein (cupin superfamily)
MYDKRGLHPYVAYLKDRYPDYGTWAAGQGLAVISGRYVEDCRTVPLSPWLRTGGTGAFINLSDQTVDDAFLSEIPPGRSLHPDRHLYEELIYVISGAGRTAMWQGGEDPVWFEWSAGSLFAVPLNAWYQHHNADDGAPARLLCLTNAPLTINIFHSVDFVTDCDFTFTDRFAGEVGRADDGTMTPDGIWDRLWKVNFVPDVRRLAASDDNQETGRGTAITVPESTMELNVCRLQAGTYARARAYRPGVHVYILGGEGYTLMRAPGGEPKRFDWHEGTLVSPPTGWYHQHFNTGSAPAAYLELRHPAFVYDNSGDAMDIAYEEEDPRVRADYAREIAARGLKIVMPPVGRDD